jgi:hypothetical protein
MRDAREAPKRLEGLLSQLAAIKARRPDAVLTDLRSALVDVERLVPKAGAEKQSTMLALYALFNSIVAPEQRMPNFRAFMDRHLVAVTRPTSATLVAFTIVGETEIWSLDVHREALDRYFAKRATPKGLHAPRVFEAAMCLALAERYRSVGRFDDARQMVARAVESCPGTPALLELETSMDSFTPIDWNAVLFPRPAVKETPTSGPG